MAPAIILSRTVCDLRIWNTHFFYWLLLAPLSVIPFAQEAAGEVEHTMGVGQENGSSKQIFGLILYLETNMLYILGNNIQIYIRFLIYHYHLVYVDWWCFGQQICWAFPKMSEFKAHPVRALFRVWVYLLILANPLQRRDGKHRESLVHTQHSRGKLNRRKLPDKSWQQGVCHWALELETLNTLH